jgi:hypothetical protein
VTGSGNAFHPDKLREENIKSLSQDNRFPVEDLNPEPPKYEADVLTTQTQ